MIDEDGIPSRHTLDFLRVFSQQPISFNRVWIDVEDLKSLIKCAEWLRSNDVVLFRDPKYCCEICEGNVND